METHLILLLLNVYCTKALSYLESDDIHAEDRGVEVDGVWDTFHCENQMIQMTQLNWTGSLEFHTSCCLNGRNLKDVRSLFQLSFVLLPSEIKKNM